jgi:hypothetical protein
MTNIKYPIFLSGKPTGKDKFAGGSHKKTAKIITETIKTENLEKRVIGLEGEWGSGKSNVIKIIEDQLGDEYYTFIFDSWGNQEDLTRKSFLEQLISQLFKKDFLTNTKKWEKLESELLSKTSKIHKQKFPKTKPYWVLLTLSILFLAGFSSFYDNVLVLNNDIIHSIDFGPFWKPVLSVYVLPILLFIWALFLGAKDYFKQRSDNSKKEKIKQESKWDTLGKIFYWFSGQEVDTEELENILEDEPSVKKFREYFSKIEEDIKANNKKIVIVFDNIDRLEDEKIKSLWSSIHTFFAEDTDSVASWIIIPYDKGKLNNCFDGNGFIEKTFAINFRVTPPVVTEWESFLSDSIDFAFGKRIMTAKEKEYVIKLFDILIESPTIKPRQVINYVNDLVAQYLQWEEEVKSGEIKLRYLALFILTKDEISKKPNEIILSRSYLKTAISQFDNLAELDENISAITFGVEKKLANEVLLFRELQRIFREGDSSKIDDFSNHAAFDNYFYKAYSSLELPDKINGLVNILGSSSDFLSEQRIRQYWNDFAKNILVIDNQFEKFSDNHKAILINSTITLSKKVLLKLIDSLKSSINSEKQITQNVYYEQLIEIESFLKANEAIKIDLIKLIKPVIFNSEPFIDLVSVLKNDYKKYNISCDNDELITSFYEDEVSEEIDLEKLESKLDELVTINKDYKLSKLTKQIKDDLEKIGYNKIEELTKYIKIIKKLNDKPIKLKLSNTYYSQLSPTRVDEDDIYIDALSIAISNFDDAIPYQNFKNTLSGLTEENIEKVSEQMECYIDYGNILDLISKKPLAYGYESLKQIVVNITSNRSGNSKLLINNVITNYSSIVENIFDDDDEQEDIFIKRLNNWSSRYEEMDGSKIDEKLFNKFNMQELDLIKKITKTSINYFNDLSKQEIIDSFVNKDRNYTMINSLISNNLIKDFSDNFYSAIDDYLKSIAREEQSIPNILFLNNLIDLLDARRLKSTYTHIREIFFNERGEIGEDEIFFFEKGLIAHGNLDKKPDESTLKVVLPMIESDKCFGSFLNNKDKLLSIISSSEHKETAISELQIRYNSEDYVDNDIMKEIAKSFKLKIIKKDDDGES